MSAQPLVPLVPPELAPTLPALPATCSNRCTCWVLLENQQTTDQHWEVIGLVGAEGGAGIGSDGGCCSPDGATCIGGQSIYLSSCGTEVQRLADLAAIDQSQERPIAWTIQNPGNNFCSVAGESEPNCIYGGNLGCADLTTRANCPPGTSFDYLSESCKPNCPSGFQSGLGGLCIALVTPPPTNCEPCSRRNAQGKCVLQHCPECSTCDAFHDKGVGKLACIPAPCVPPCPPPGLIQIVNGVPVCMMDPPIPSKFPMITPFRAWSPLPSSRSFPSAPRMTRPEFSKSFLALDPTRRRGIPFVMKACACNDSDEFQEEAIA